MTLQELDVIYSNAYEKAYYFGEPPHFKALPADEYIALSEWASLQAMAAVVRALRDEVSKHDYLREVDFMFNEILGDAGEKVAGRVGETKHPDVTSPAIAPTPAVCVWTKYMNGAATTSCQPIYCLEVGNKKPGDDCPLCWKEIKFTEAKT